MPVTLESIAMVTCFFSMMTAAFVFIVNLLMLSVFRPLYSDLRFLLRKTRLPEAARRLLALLICVVVLVGFSFVLLFGFFQVLINYIPSF